jgi:3-oxoadipate enol-lactonase
MERRVAVEGGELRVVDEGAGPAVVLLHASIACLEACDGLAPLLVAAGYRVVRYDLRGSGGSATQAVPYSSRADLVAVLDALGIDRSAFVGNSVGGIIALEASLEFPERAVAAVTLAPYVVGFDAPVTPAEQALFDEEERLDALEPPGAEAMVAFDVAIWGDGPRQPAGRAPAWIRRRLAEWIRDNARPDRVAGKRIPLDPPAATRLSKSNVPNPRHLERAELLRHAGGGRSARGTRGTWWFRASPT